MPVVYRLVRKKHARPADLLSGDGAALVGGRWNEKGTRLVYATSHVSLAVVEALVHAQVLPKDMMLVELDVPEAVPIGRWPRSTLPADWATYPTPASTQLQGTAWVHAGRELAVWVPSAVVPSEWNCLVNPVHPEIRRVRAKVLGPFHFDQRLCP
jgi:RES domain-containing protein